MDPPSNMSGLKTYIKLLKTLEKSDPLSAYYVSLFVIEKGMTLNDKSPDSEAFLKSLFSVAETLKETNQIPEDGREYMVGVIFSVFQVAQSQADSPDTALKYFLVSLLVDSLEYFGPLDQSAVDIKLAAQERVKDINSGRKAPATVEPVYNNPVHVNREPVHINSCSDRAHVAIKCDQSVRFLRMAITSLEFDDLDQARANIINALNNLNGL